jgi:hypothetical protein
VGETRLPPRAAALVSLAALAGTFAAVALAGPGDPQKKPTAADQARARAIVLSRADLGAGWRRDTSSGSGSRPRCSFYNPDQSDLVETGHAETSFRRGNTNFVTSSVGIFRTVAQAKTAYRRVVRPELPRCLAEIFAKGTGNPKAVRILSAGPLPFPGFGDRSNAYRLRATYTTSSATIPVTLDTVLINRGRSDVLLGFIGIGPPAASSLERFLSGKVAARLPRR